MKKKTKKVLFISSIVAVVLLVLAFLAWSGKLNIAQGTILTSSTSQSYPSASCSASSECESKLLALGATSQDIQELKQKGSLSCENKICVARLE